MSGLQKRILAVLMLGTMMSAVDTTIVLLAIPQITNALGTNLATSIWVIIAYLLVIAILTTQLGRVGDIFGRGKMFNLGFMVFTVGSILCGASGFIGGFLGISAGIYLLIAFRVLQGIGGAMLQANSGAIIADTFERHHRGKAFGYVALGWNVGSMLGIVLGGVLTTFAGWPYIFYINLPIGAVALWYGLRYIKDNEHKNEQLDLKGMAVLSAMLMLITLGGTEIVSQGATSLNIAMIIIGFIMLPVFVIIERRVKFPTVDFAVFKNRILAASMLAALFQGLGYLAVVFIVIMYLQGVRGLTPLDASLLLIPGYVLSGFTGPYMGRLSDKLGARVLATVGILLMLATVILYVFFLTANTSYYLIVLATVISGIGASMFFPANSSAVMANVQGNAFGSASGLLRMMSNIGTLGSYIITITVASLAVSSKVAFSVFIGTSDLSGNISTEFLGGIQAVFIISAMILVIAALLSVLRGKEQRHQWPNQADGATSSNHAAQ
jgi:EmrB/QacA subfamily drug resistance transporter